MCASSRFFLALLVLAGLLGWSSSVAQADWDPSMPAKYVQMPDLAYGLDVNATWLWDTSQVPWPTDIPTRPPFPTPTPQPNTPSYWKVLADDFPCYQAGLITDVHIWGSWLGDNVNPYTVFKLSIHDDVPVSDQNPYSHPGEVRWEMLFKPGEYKVTPPLTANEAFYDPNTNLILGDDTQVFQYNFLIDPSEAFYQEGPMASGAPTVYWLDVQAIVPWDPGTPQTIFGWKTSKEVWQDDAVFADTDVPGGPPTGPVPDPPEYPVFWRDMHYPDGHEYEGESINMAFAITPEPSTWVLILAGGLPVLILYLRRRRK